MENKNAQRYLAQTRHCLICSRADRTRLLSRAATMVSEYGMESPEAEYADYLSAFGQPSDFASEMLSTLDPERVRSAARRRKWLRRAIACAVVLALVLLAGFFYFLYRASQSWNVNTEIKFDEPIYITEEEFQRSWDSAPPGARFQLGDVP